MLMPEDAHTEDRGTAAPSATLPIAALRALVDRSTDLTVLVGVDGRITYLSSAAERVWGYDPGEHLGTHFGGFVHPDDLELVTARFALAADLPGATVVIDFRLLRADGEWRHVDVYTTNLLDDPDVRAMAIHIRDVHERIETSRQLTWRAQHDTLTGLANRAAFLERVETALGDRERPPAALLYVDLDGFKAVNDSYGHEAGDRLLTVIGSRLRRAVRASDCAARIGGDEFVVLVDELPTLDLVEALAARIVAALSEPVSLGPGEPAPEITASVGIAFAGDHDANELLVRADRALYAAKRRGRGQVQVDAGRPSS